MPKLHCFAALPIPENSGPSLRVLFRRALFDIPERIWTGVSNPLHLQISRMDAATLDVVTPPFQPLLESQLPPYAAAAGIVPLDAERDSIFGEAHTAPMRSSMPSAISFGRSICFASS